MFRLFLHGSGAIVHTSEMRFMVPCIFPFHVRLAFLPTRLPENSTETSFILQPVTMFLHHFS